MEKKESYAKASFQITMSHLIVAKTKKQALEKAAYELNKALHHLDQITLENEAGETVVFGVHQVEEMDWYDVEYTEYSSQFRVIGQLQLIIKPLSEMGLNELKPLNYQIPRSHVYDKPILIISDCFKHIFMTVIQQKLEWQNKFKSAMFISKLA